MKVMTFSQSNLNQCTFAFRERIQGNVGLLLLLVSQVFFSSMNVAVKKLQGIDPPISTSELIFVRMSITYTLSVAYMVYAGIPHPFLGPEGVRPLLVFRGFSGYVGLLGIYFSLNYLSLSDATVLTFLVPLATGIAGVFFLGEHFALKQAFASIVSLMGVIMIARPSFLFGSSSSLTLGSGMSNKRVMAVSVSLIGVCGMTGAYVSIRALGKRVHPLHATVAFSGQCVLGSTISMFVQRTPIIIPTGLEWLGCMLMIGVFGFLAQILLTMGLQREKVARGTMAIYSQVIFAIVLEFIFFGTFPSFYSAIGIFMIVTSACYVALSKQQVDTVVLDEQSTVTNGYNSSIIPPAENIHETTALLGAKDHTNRFYN